MQNTNVNSEHQQLFGEGDNLEMSNSNLIDANSRSQDTLSVRKRTLISKEAMNNDKDLKCLRSANKNLQEV